MVGTAVVGTAVVRTAVVRTVVVGTAVVGTVGGSRVSELRELRATDRPRESRTADGPSVSVIQRRTVDTDDGQTLRYWIRY